MRKEVFIAIVAGVIFGLVVALGIWKANSAFKNDKTITTSSAPEKEDSISFDLSVLEPQENDVITNTPYEVKGVTSPNVWVAISAENDDYTLLSTSSGEFSTEVDLVGGVNQIVITAFSHTGEKIVREIRVVYSSEFNNTNQ